MKLKAGCMTAFIFASSIIMAYGAGVTVLTHGFTLSSSFPAWETGMSTAVQNRISGTPTIYRVKVVATRHPALSLDDYEVTVSNWQRGNPQTADSGEIIVEINWAECAGIVGVQGYEASTADIARRLASCFTNSTFFPGLGRPISELPLHFIGHSRGGALVMQLADLLGQQGIWADQVTTLDPHPVASGRDDTDASFPINLHENVLFADNEFQIVGSGSGEPTNPNGRSLAGAFNRDISSETLYWFNHNQGYYLLPPTTHADVHLWYHGTVDTTPNTNDTDAAITQAMRTSGYSAAEANGSKAGFYYSRLLGGTANGGTRTYNNASAGLYAPPTYQANRLPWEVNIYNARLWDNVEIVNCDSDQTFTQGNSLPVSVYFLDFNGDSTIQVGLDADQNPYNGVYKSLATHKTAAGTTIQEVAKALDTTTVTPGNYYVFASISNGEHVRYYYAKGRVGITTSTHIIRLGGDLAFGNVATGSSAQRTMTIYNDGNGPLTVSSISYPSGFSGNWGGGTIAAGGSQSVTVTFGPTAAQNYSGTITVNSDKTSGTETKSCSGTGTSSSRITIARPAANPYTTADSSYQVQGVAAGSASSVTWRNISRGTSGTANWSVDGGGAWYFNASLQDGENYLIATANYPDGTTSSAAVTIFRNNSVRASSFSYEAVTVYSGSQYTTTGSSVYCGYDPTSGTYIPYNERPLVRFLGFILPVGSEIQSAQMRCESKTAMATGDATLNTTCYRVTTSWTASRSGASWSTAQNYSTANGSSQTFRKDINDVKFFDVTEFAKLWYGGSPNNGIVLISSVENCGYVNDRYLDGFRLDVNYTTETTPPTVSIASPTAGNSYTTAALTINLSGTASDSQNVISSVTWRNELTGLSGACSGNTSWSVSGLVLAEGLNHLIITATDAAGNSATDMLDVTCTPPHKILRLSGSLAFGNVIVGSSGGASLYVCNDGDSPLSVSSISYPAGFSCNWSGSIQAGQAQLVPVTFTPSAAQGYSGTVTVNSDKTSGTNTIACSGTGIAASRIIRLGDAISFGNVVTNASGVGILMIYNDGNSPLTVTGISYPAGFSGNWNGSILAGESYGVPVTFSPTVAKNYSGTITVSSDKTSGANTLSCSGVGIPATRIIRLVGDLAFGDMAIGESSSRLLSVCNDGNSSLAVSAINCPAGFAASPQAFNIAAGDSVYVTVTFSPVALQAYSGTITVNSDKTSGTDTSSASGTGVAAVLAISPATTNLSSPAASGRTIGVTANVSWTAASNVSWLAITGGSSGNGNGTVTYGVSANSGTLRTGVIIVTGAGISRTCTVVQAGIPVMTVLPSSQSVGCAAGTTDFAVTNTGDGTMVFTANESESWLAITSGGSGTNSGTIMVEYDANGGTAARTGSITVAGSGLVRTCTVIQAGDPTAFNPLRINCGGPTISGASPWLADTGYSGGTAKTTTSAIANATNAPQAIYQARRYAPTLTYVFSDIPDGTYTIRLHFAELYSSAAGQRKFNVSIEGETKLTNFDIYQEAGGKNRAVVKTFENVAVSGGLQIQGVASVDTAQFNGIEIIAAGSPSPALDIMPTTTNVPVTASSGRQIAITANIPWTTATNVPWLSITGSASGTTNGTVTFSVASNSTASTRTGSITVAGSGLVRTCTVVQAAASGGFAARRINCGGPAISGATPWLADTGFLSGGVWTTTATIANATSAPMAVYQRERSGAPVRYSIGDVPNGAYRVKLHFNESSTAAKAGARVFHVDLEGARALNNLDVFVAAGGSRRALVRAFDVAVAGDNGLQIELTRVAGYPQINGIEIEAAGPPAPAIVASVTQVAVPEGGTATFGVHLDTAPAGATTVTVVRASGDADIAVSGGADLVFTPANYAIDQAVTLAAAEDADTANGTAAIQCAAEGYVAAGVTATEQDNDAPPFSLKVNCGGSAVTGGWVADTGYSGGTAKSTTSAIANATNAPLAIYQTRRYAPTLTYSFPAVPDGTYTIRLHFAELYCGAAGRRIFNVAIEGQTRLTNFDIYQAAGGKYRAVVRTFENVAVRGGLQIQGVASVDGAQFNGIEILAEAGARKTAIQASAAPLAQRPAPDVVRSSEDARTPGAGWAAVDGDAATVWQAAGNRGSWICLGYAEPVQVRAIDVHFAAGSPLGLNTLASEDAVDWFELEPELELGPVELNYLWFLIPADLSAPPPAVREIEVHGVSTH